MQVYVPWIALAVSILTGPMFLVFLPWLLRAKITEVVGPLITEKVSEKLTNHLTKDDLRLTLEHFNQQLSKDFATREELASLKGKLENLASKEAVIELTGKVNVVLTILEQLDKRLEERLRVHREH